MYHSARPDRSIRIRHFLYLFKWFTSPQRYSGQHSLWWATNSFRIFWQKPDFMCSVTATAVCASKRWRRYGMDIFWESLLEINSNSSAWSRHGSNSQTDREMSWAPARPPTASRAETIPTFWQEWRQSQLQQSFRPSVGYLRSIYKWPDLIHSSVAWIKSHIARTNFVYFLNFLSACILISQLQGVIKLLIRYRWKRIVYEQHSRRLL